MAKRTRNLAALAGLAGLAYAMSNKGKGKSTTDSNPTRAARFESTETRLKSPAESIAAADKSDKSTSISTKGESGTTTPGPDKSTPNLDVKPTPVKPRNVVTGNDLPPAKLKSVSEPSDKSIKLAPENRNLEAGMSRGTRTPAKPVSTVSSSAEGMKNYKPRRTPAASTSSSSEEGMKNYKPRSTQATPVRDTAVQGLKTAVQGPASVAKPLADKATNAMRETYRDLSGKVQYKTPDLPSTAKTVSDAVTSGVKKVGSGIADYVRNFETPAERRSREAKESSGMKRGGAVKMASGGMAASRRGDGIAQRGKTRGKMC